MELPKRDEESTASESGGEQTKSTEDDIPNKENDAETDTKNLEEKNTKETAPEDTKNAEEVSKEDPVHLDDILSQIVQDTIIDSPTKTVPTKTDTNITSTSSGTTTNNNKRKPPNNPPKQPAKARRQAEPRIRSAPSVFLQRSTRAPPVPKQVAKKNLADQYNNCVHGDPGDYLCVDCFYNRWQAEWDFLQPIQST